MIRTLVAAALLLASGIASAQGLNPQRPGISAGRVLAQFPLVTPGCYASGTGGISIARTTVATYIDGAGDLQTCASGQYRVAPDGLLVEPARTNYLLNASTHPKTNEATASLTTGAHVAWHAGTGTMTVAAGTATVTGLSCSSVAAETVCSFTVTVAGTMLVTTTDGTTRAQVEKGSYKTSFIPTSGASAPRNADVVTATVPAIPANAWCIAFDAKPEEGRLWSTLTNANTLMHLGTNTSAANNTLWDATRYLIRDSSAGFKINSNSAFASSAPHRLVACNTGGTASMTSDGAPVTLTVTGAGTGVQATMPTNLYLGTQNSPGSEFGGFLKNVRICAAKKPSECK